MDDDIDVKLQENLLKQHENYARQKELLQKLKQQSEAAVLHQSTRSSREFLPSPKKKDEAKLQDIYAQEVVNDNLRKQLELIRRMEHENTRLRSDNTTLKSQCTLLEERSKVKEIEMGRLNNEVNHVNDAMGKLRNEYEDQIRQNGQLKQLLTKATRLKETLEDELQTSLESQRKLHERIDQLEFDCQQAILREQTTAANSKSHESHQIRANATIQSLQEELNNVQIALAQKTEQCTTIQASSNACIEQIEASLKSAQDSLSKEQDKRRHLESVCIALENDLDSYKAKEKSLEAALEAIKELRARNGLLEEKLPYYHQLEYENKEMHGKLLHAQRDREEQERNMVQLKQGIWQTTNVLKKEIEAMRMYLMSMEDEGLLAEDVEVLVASWHECPTEIQHLRTILTHFKHDLVHVSKQIVSGRENERQLTEQCQQLHQKLIDLKNELKDVLHQLNLQKEACAIAESARELSSREKRDLLLWSRNTCQKTERMASEVEQWEQFTLQQIHRMHRLPWQDISTPIAMPDLKYNTYAELRQNWEAALTTLLTEAQQCHVKYNQEAHRANKESKKKLDMMKKLDAAEHEYQRKIHEKEIEMQACQLRHTNSMQALQEQHQCLLKENDTQIALQSRHVEELTEKWTRSEHERIHFKQLVDGLEADTPIYMGIFQLFIVCLRPMVLQISELQMQKRILTHQVNHLAAQRKEIEDIASLFQPSQVKRPLLLIFRAAALAVIACNRLRQTNKQYGRNEALGMVFPQQIGVVKLLPMTSATQLQAAIKRLHAKDFADKCVTLEQISNTPSTSAKRHTIYGQSPLGELLLDVLNTIDPHGQKTIQNVLQGHASFLCDLRPVRIAQNAVKSVDVHRIRREILEWMKKVENLQFQRTALQKENYVLQNAIHDKDFKLKELELLNANTQELKQKLAMYQTHDGHNITVREFEQCVEECKNAEMKIAQLEEIVTEKKLLIKDLEMQLSMSTERSKHMEEQLTQARQALLDEEDTVLNLKSVISRYEVEMRKLSQAAQSVHTQFQQRCSEAEQDKVELHALSTMLQETKKKNESLEAELKVIQHDLLGNKQPSPVLKDDPLHHSHRYFGSHHNIRPAQETKFTIESKPHYSRSHASSSASSIASKLSNTGHEKKMHMADLDDDDNDLSMNLDKVNFAVHSYMDRIDKKLQSMYGIPESGKWRDYKLQDL
ncbi:hypothetical protein THRCLA_01346 [Thraustotheca clavata]|uniref:Uncharacterized protein n=1 Tax=Thraustotheca clavata TaxID=74557 RepID=A0A1W0A8W3_9STRA|nr:hypothetical protein THRCLA_01346 [Thraustotheca clavata]